MDQTAISARAAAYIMIDAGLTLEQVQRGIWNIEQVTKGYYLIDDVNQYIREAI